MDDYHCTEGKSHPAILPPSTTSRTHEKDLFLLLLLLSLVLGQVLIVGVVLGRQLIELGLLVLDHVLQHSVCTAALLFRALGAVGSQGIGQQTLQFAGIGRALALVHKAPEVVVEEAVGLEDLVQVDVIEAGCVGLLREHYTHDDREEAGQEEFHGDGTALAGRREGRKSIYLQHVSEVNLHIWIAPPPRRFVSNINNLQFSSAMRS